MMHLFPVHLSSVSCRCYCLGFSWKSKPWSRFYYWNQLPFHSICHRFDLHFLCETYAILQLCCIYSLSICHCWWCGYSNLRIPHCLSGASGRSENISMPLLFCLLCWPYFNASDAEIYFVPSQRWHMRICSHGYHLFMIFWFSFQLTHTHMLW